MKEAVLRLGFISFVVVLVLFGLVVLLAQVQDPAGVRRHQALNHLAPIELWNSFSASANKGFKAVVNGKKTITGLHLYPSKNFWLASSRRADTTYFTKKDLKENRYIKWSVLLQKYPKQRFFAYVHSQNPVDLFRFIKVSEKHKGRLLIYSDFLKTAAWFRKEAPLMALGASPTVLLRMNFFSKLWLEGLVPVRAHFAYIAKPRIGFAVMKELKRRNIVVMLSQNLVKGEKKTTKKFREFIKNTFPKKMYSLVIENNGI
ncbi:MAG: hypothetical protein HAW63_05585 [Bdellovibrionaceae bacterium]|nr:hypothetical protein [Pseudobdellovibrionaceae bacterium]